MLTPELSRLKGNEKASMGDATRARHERKPDTLKSSKIPNSACLARSCLTKLTGNNVRSPVTKRSAEQSSNLKATAEPEIAARESGK